MFVIPSRIKYLRKTNKVNWKVENCNIQHSGNEMHKRDDKKWNIIHSNDIKVLTS